MFRQNIYGTTKNCIIVYISVLLLVIYMKNLINMHGKYVKIVVKCSVVPIVD